MPQQHNPGRHVQSLTLPQSRHNHRNTSAYIFPTVPTPRTTPPTPGPNAPTQLASAIQDTSPPPHAAPLRPDASDHLTSADPQCSTSPPRLTRAIQDTPLPPHNGSTVPTPRTIPPTPEPATRRALPHLTAGTQRSNIPPQLASAIQDTSPPPHNGPHTIPTPRTTPPTPEPATRRAQKNPALRAGPIHLSVIFQ